MPATSAAAQDAPVVARIPLPHPDAQTVFDGQFAVTNDAIWIADARGSYLVRVDVATNRISEVQIEPPDLSAGDAGLWMISPVGEAPGPQTITLSRVDLKTGRVSFAMSLPGGSRLAVGLGGVWVTDGELRLLGPTNLKVLRQFRVDGNTIEVACGALWNWASSPDYLHPWRLQRLDPLNGRVLEQISLPDAVIPGRLQEIAGLCWTTTYSGLLGIEPGHGISVTTSTGPGGRPQIAGTSVWSWSADGVIQRIDTRTGMSIGNAWRLPEQDLHSDPKGQPDWRLLSAGGSLWLLGGNEIVRYRIPTGG